MSTLNIHKKKEASLPGFSTTTLHLNNITYIFTEGIDMTGPLLTISLQFIIKLKPLLGYGTQ